MKNAPPDELRPLAETSPNDFHARVVEDELAVLREIDSPPVQPWLAAQAWLTKETLEATRFRHFEAELLVIARAVLVDRNGR